MRYIAFFILLTLTLIGCSPRLNRLNKNKQRTGKWVTYADKENTIKTFEGRFKNGVGVGKAYYYTLQGVLFKKEVARFKKLKTTTYYPNGVVKSKGNAKIENLPDRIHYYYYGKWSNYNEKGELVKYEYYNKGAYVRSVYVDKNNKLNDSLLYALNNLETEFNAHRNQWHDSIAKYNSDPLKKKLYRQKYDAADSLTFSQVDQILCTYGYPSSEQVGDAYLTPFYLISFAPIALKEKHYDLLLDAVKKEVLSGKSFAFFADKLRIAKGQKQLYGTQSYYDTNKNEIIYPCEDPDNLKSRRKSMGFED